MELDRHLIERHDFAQARRGYDPDEVDRHLAEVADAVEELRHSRFGQAGPTSLAGAAADQVRTIVEAAERSAAEIETTARTEAERLTTEAKRQAESERSSARSEAEQARSEAASDAQRTRQQAESDAREHVSKVQEVTSAMMARADTVESDLGALVDQLRTNIDSLLESVRTNAGSLEAELSEIQAGLAVIREAPPEPPAEEEVYASDEPEAGEPGADAAEDAYEEDGTEEYAEDEAGGQPVELVAEDEDEHAEDEVEEEPAEEERPAGGDGAEGARLIALNMALNGTPRDETSRYLEENFDLEDREAILDEVYARVGG